jgi:hypothetical protein
VRKLFALVLLAIVLGGGATFVSIESETVALAGSKTATTPLPVTARNYERPPASFPGQQ